MRLGIGSYTYSWAVGVAGFPLPARPLRSEDLLERAVQLGVRVVQIADNLPLLALGQDELAKLARRAQALGVTIEVGTAGIAPEHLRAYLAIALCLRSPILRTLLDTPGVHPTPEEAVRQLRQIVPVFEAAGVVLAIENHDRFPARVLRSIVEALDSPHVGICLDTANSLGCMEGPENVVELLGPYSVNLHVKDVHVARAPHLKGFMVSGRPAGAGDLDIPWILRRLKELSADPNVILELWQPPSEPLDEVVRQEAEWARQGIAYLRQLIPD